MLMECFVRVKTALIQASIYFALKAIHQPQAINDLFVDVDIESEPN
jgi:hypothetical protein